MTVAETISICSLSMICLSFGLTVQTYVQQTRSSRVAQTERLHEVWWSSDMMETREIVYALRKDPSREFAHVEAIAAYYHSPLTEPDPPGRAAFSKLIGFFCNLEICLRTGVLNEELTCSLFGEAHYADYQPLIAKLRSTVIANTPPGRSPPGWLMMTQSLEERLSCRGIDFTGGRML